MHILKHSIHSLTDTETSSLFSKTILLWWPFFSSNFGAWPEAHEIPISVLSSHKDIGYCISPIFQEQGDSRCCICQKPGEENNLLRTFCVQTWATMTMQPFAMGDCLLQWSSLAPLYCSIFSTRSRQYGYAEDLALFHLNKSSEELEKTLSADMFVIADYLSAWKLKLSVTKKHQPLSTYIITKQSANQQKMSGSTLCSATPIQLILGSSWIVNWSKSNKSRAYVRKPLYATILCAALLTHHGCQYIHYSYIRSCNSL